VNACPRGDLLRSGRSFRLEREMLGSARRWLNNQSLLVKKEFYTPWGVCDLVGISLSNARVRQRLDFGQRLSIGPLQRIALLNRIPDFETGDSVTWSQLAADFQGFLSESDLHNELEHLIKSKFVQRAGPACFHKLNGWAPLHNRIVALELKLERVEEALFQATSHLKFATESYVGVPEKVAHRVYRTSVHHFETTGVGLVAIARHRSRVLVRSRPNRDQTDSVFQMHCAERFWRSHVTGNSP
jgi:hypothetical protein